ncbi:MAG: hypothetical protein ACW97A_07760 [Candidatus Thorarchaeota archaeon]|jgi:hypothetical protein
MEKMRRIRTADDIRRNSVTRVISKWEERPEILSSLDPMIRHIVIYGGRPTRKISSKEREEQRNLWKDGFRLSSLSSLKYLESLRIVNMNVMDFELDLSPLTLCETLKMLEIHGDFPTMDMSSLKDIPNLETLMVHFSSSSRRKELPDAPRDAFRPDLYDIAGCERLLNFYMRASYERLDLSPFRGHSNLVNIDVGCKHFLDLTPLGKCPSLETLSAKFAWLLSVRLPQSESLKKVDLSNGELTTPWGAIWKRGMGDSVKRDEVFDLSQLIGCDNLQLVDLKNNHLKLLSFDFLRDWSTDRLPSFDTRNNPLLGIDVSPIPEDKIKSPPRPAGITIEYAPPYPQGVIIDPAVKRVHSPEEMSQLVGIWEE